MQSGMHHVTALTGRATGPFHSPAIRWLRRTLNLPLAQPPLVIPVELDERVILDYSSVGCVQSESIAMGRKGARLTEEASESAALLVKRLTPLGEVTSRKMFGGYGIFESGTMFALVTSEGVPHLKVGDTNIGRFEKAGAEKFGRMPYYAIPARVLNSTRSLRSWAREALAVAQSTK